MSLYYSIHGSKKEPERSRSWRAYFGGRSRGCAPSGVQRQSPWWEVKGEATRPQKLKAFEMYAANFHSKILCAYIGKDQLCDNRLVYERRVEK